MRRAVLLLAVLVGLGATWVWLPSVLLQGPLERHLVAALQARGPVSVRAVTSPLALVRGRIERLDVTAVGVRAGDVTASRLVASFRGVTARRAGAALEIVAVTAGTVQVELTAADLEGYLGARGVEQASVRIAADGIEASGAVRAGPVLAAVRVRGQFYVADRSDVYFRIDALDLSGMDIPPAAATAMLAMAGRPVVTLRGLPVPARIERIAAREGRLIVDGRVGEEP
ncbi:MAG: hypothetical protein QN159_00125 [Armatimonadota bacterium]|nr:hypothetical protein [Armatimonadota bacterium]